MKTGKWTAIAVAIGMIGLAGCAQTAPVTPEQQAPTASGDRQVLSVGSFPSLAEIEAQLPERIPEAEADKLLVELDASQVRAPGASYGVLDADDEDDQKVVALNRDGSLLRSGSALTATRAFVHDRFFPRSLGLRYYGFGNYYFPYYYNAGFYYPYRNILAPYGAYNYLYSPFYWRNRGLYWPSSYNLPITYNVGGSVGLVGYGAD